MPQNMAGIPYKTPLYEAGMPISRGLPRVDDWRNAALRPMSPALFPVRKPQAAAATTLQQALARNQQDDEVGMSIVRGMPRVDVSGMRGVPSKPAAAPAAINPAQQWPSGENVLTPGGYTELLARLAGRIKPDPGTFSRTENISGPIRPQTTWEHLMGITPPMDQTMLQHIPSRKAEPADMGLRALVDALSSPQTTAAMLGWTPPKTQEEKDRDYRLALATVFGSDPATQQQILAPDIRRMNNAATLPSETVDSEGNQQTPSQVASDFSKDMAVRLAAILQGGAPEPVEEPDLTGYENLRLASPDQWPQVEQRMLDSSKSNVKLINDRLGKAITAYQQEQTPENAAAVTRLLGLLDEAHEYVPRQLDNIKGLEQNRTWSDLGKTLSPWAENATGHISDIGRWLKDGLLRFGSM